MVSRVDTTSETAGQGLEANKDAVRSLLAALTDRRYGEAAALMTPDATWWMLSRRKAIPIVIWLKGYESQTEPLFPAGLRLEPSAFTAEADRVAVQAQGIGTTAAGHEYHNDFHFLFEFEGVLIRAAWEYGDTVHAQQVFG